MPCRLLQASMLDTDWNELPVSRKSQQKIQLNATAAKYTHLHALCRKGAQHKLMSAMLIYGGLICRSSAFLLVSLLNTFTECARIRALWPATSCSTARRGQCLGHCFSQASITVIDKTA